MQSHVKEIIGQRRRCAISYSDAPRVCLVVSNTNLFILLRSKGQLLGYVDAIDEKGAEAAAAEQFKLDAFQSRRLLVQELAQ